MNVKSYVLMILLIVVSYTTRAQKEATAYFAGGCFWCVEAIFETVRGVNYAESGYGGGEESNPTYKDVALGLTGHAEVVRVVYDPRVIAFHELLEVFFNAHDPTTKNAQGPDRGTQYRSIVFYQNEQEKKEAIDFIKKLLDGGTFKRITTEIKEFKKFYKAEDYHQDFEKRNPNNPYVQSVSQPRLRKFKLKSKKYLKP